MTNEQWLDVFKGIGSEMRAGIAEFLSREGGAVPVGKGAGGDKTFPVDRWAEDIVIAALEDVHAKGEDFTLVSEEMGARRFGESDTLLLVDPIDGSNNAKSGIPMFGVSIALIHGMTFADISAAYVINLPTGEEYWAIRGEGALKDGRRIHTSSSEDIIIVGFEASNPKTDIPAIMPLLASARRTRCFGSMALDLVFLASGGMSVFVTANPARAFDYAAGYLILREAGGVITDIKGASLGGMAAGLNRTVPLLAAANQRLHQKALALLSTGKQACQY